MTAPIPFDEAARLAADPYWPGKWLDDESAIFSWEGEDGSIWITEAVTHHIKGYREAVVRWDGCLWWSSSLNGLDGVVGEEIIATYPSHHTLIGGWSPEGEWVDGDSLPPLPDRFWDRWNAVHPAPESTSDEPLVAWPKALRSQAK